MVRFRPFKVQFFFRDLFAVSLFVGTVLLEVPFAAFVKRILALRFTWCEGGEGITERLRESFSTFLDCEHSIRKVFFLFQDAIHSYGDRKLPINGLNSLNIVSSYKCLSYTDQSSCIEGLTKFNFFPAIFRKREAVFVLFLHLRGRGTDFKARAILVPRKCTANFL